MDWRFPLGWSFAGMLAAALLVCAWAAPAFAQPAGGVPTYQRQNSSMGPGQGITAIGVTTAFRSSTRRKFRPAHFSDLILITSTTIKMKYGGSYAPYFGNLYGPPNQQLLWHTVRRRLRSALAASDLALLGSERSFGAVSSAAMAMATADMVTAARLVVPAMAGMDGGPQCGVPYGPWAGQSEGRAPVEGEVVEAVAQSIRSITAQRAVNFSPAGRPTMRILYSRTHRNYASASRAARATASFAQAFNQDPVSADPTLYEPQVDIRNGGVLDESYGYHHQGQERQSVRPGPYPPAKAGTATVSP